MVLYNDKVIEIKHAVYKKVFTGLQENFPWLKWCDMQTATRHVIPDQFNNHIEVFQSRTSI